MKNLNLKATTKPQEVVKAFLEQNASDVLADKINNGVSIQQDGKTLINKKTLDGFMEYATSEAQKIAEKGARCSCVQDNIVFGWAIHYFEEDSIIGELFNEDGSKYTPVPKKVEKKNITKKTEKKPTLEKKDKVVKLDNKMSRPAGKNIPSTQLSFIDLFAKGE